jgi:hypothetical protein
MNEVVLQQKNVDRRAGLFVIKYENNIDCTIVRLTNRQNSGKQKTQYCTVAALSSCFAALSLAMHKFLK